MSYSRGTAETYQQTIKTQAHRVVEYQIEEKSKAPKELHKEAVNGIMMWVSRDKLGAVEFTITGKRGAGDLSGVAPADLSNVKLEAAAICIGFQWGSFQPGLVGEAAGIITLEAGSSGLTELLGWGLAHKVPAACLEGVSPSTAILWLQTRTLDLVALENLDVV